MAVCEGPMKPRVLLSGAGGFGESYVRLLSALHDEGAIDWVGVVDPFADRSGLFFEIEKRRIPVFAEIAAFQERLFADLAVLCSPIAVHCEQAIAAMEGGSDVLLEKPVAATMPEARRILDARNATGRAISVAFQWCYDPVMLKLKALSDAGAFGRLRRMRSLVLWPRPTQYYQRNTWAGKRYDDAGRPVFDNISSNAAAHYLFNMLWLAGEGYLGAPPQGVRASLWRANAIETFDTATLLVTLPDGVEALHVASHAAGRTHKQNPMFLYEYEGATVSFGAYGKTCREIWIDYPDGRRENLGRSNPDTDEKLKRTLRELGTGAPSVCPVEAACRHLAVMEMLRAQQTPVRVFDRIEADGEMLWVPGLFEQLIDCYEGFHLLADS